MNLFSRRRRTESTRLGAARESTAAILASRADLRARLDAELARATDITLAAATAWATLDDPRPGDTYLTEALSGAGLWGSEHEPGTHIARWSEDYGTVTLRSWDWDLTRPLGAGDYARISRVRTLPWPSKSDQKHGRAAENDSGDSEVLSTPAPLSAEPPMNPARDSTESLGGLTGDHDSRPSQTPRLFTKLPDENRAFQKFAVALIAGMTIVILYFVVDLNSLSTGLGVPLVGIVLYPIFLWMDRRGWLRPRSRAGRRPRWPTD